MVVIPGRLKALAAAGILAGGMGAAALGGAFAAPAPENSLAAAATPTAAAAATGTAAPATASNPASTAVPESKEGRGPRGFEAGKSIIGPVAGFLGISTTDLQTALKNGQSLAQIAQAHGKSASDLKTFMTSQLKTSLDKAVADGKMTSQQETDALNKASASIDKMINSSFKGMPGKGRRPMRGGWMAGPYLSTVAQTLGMKPADVQTELKSGKTLAQIAQEHGKTANDLETAIINSLKPRLEKLMNTNFKQLQQQRGQHGKPGASATTTPPTATATPKP